MNSAPPSKSFFEKQELRLAMARRALIERLSKLWSVAPYRINAEFQFTGDTRGTVRLSLDGEKIPQHLLDVYNADFQEKSALARKQMN